MDELYFECCGIKIKLVGTSDCIYEIKYVNKQEISNSNDFLEIVKEKLCDYIKGENFELDFRYCIDATPFKKNIYETLSKTEVGEFISYKTLGERANTNAYRVVGSAMRTNKLPIIIPCHRVVRNDHSLGNYTGGVNIKKHLFYLETRYAMNKKIMHEHKFNAKEINFILNHDILKQFNNKMMIRTSFFVHNDMFHCLISQVIHQLISFKTAREMESRVYSYFGYHITPNSILKLTKSEAKVIGLPLNKLEYMRNIAIFYIENEEFFRTINSKTSKEIFEKLKHVRGIGRWTIEMFLIFGLARKDVFSFDDLILLNGYKHLYKVEKPTLEEKRKFLCDIKGNETIVAINMWYFLEQKLHLD